MKMNKLDIHRLLVSPLAKRIDQGLVERWAASFWATRGATGGRQRQSEDQAAPFVMMLPPPNITGNLHLGHALTASLQDALIRQRQMAGHRAIWIPGFDHAGLATQNLVEKLLWHQQGLTRQAIGREKFTAMANDWKGRKLSDIKRQLDRLGLALDYEREYFTMDEKSSKAVDFAFKRLFELGIIYRQERPVHWSQQLQTTLSDIEVIKDEQGVERYFRTGEVVDKKLISQWFIDTRKMALRAVDVVRDESLQLIPPNYKRSWSSWLVENGIKDWCISRQSWWGHRIPAYKLASAIDTQESWIVASSLDEAKGKLGSNEVVQDDDVLDTWFSSSLLPLTVAGWPDQEQFANSQRSGIFPLDIMETGFDILNYWVSKMVMISLALENKIPFKLILLHGMICDSEGKKMSKSKGNVIDPLNIIDGASLKELQQETENLCSDGVFEEEQLKLALENQKKLFPTGIPSCGADGLRAYLLSHDVQEEVVRIRIEQIDKIRRFSNKIWNIFRFILPIIEVSHDKLDLNLNVQQLQESKLDLDDIEVLRELAQCVIVARTSFETDYQLHLSFKALEYFWTIHLSTTYLEKVKQILLKHDDSNRLVKLQVITICLTTATKLMHPYMPHITEFLYQKLALAFEKDSANGIAQNQCLINEEYPRKEDWETSWLQEANRQASKKTDEHVDVVD